MSHRSLSLAVLAAAAIVPIAGCGDHQSSTPQAVPSTDPPMMDNSASSDASKLPINGAKKPHQKNAPPSLADQVKTLRQQVASDNQAAHQRFAQQAQQINALQQTVKRLETRLRRLPLPSAFKHDNKPDTATSSSAQTGGSDPTPSARHNKAQAATHTSDAGSSATADKTKATHTPATQTSAAKPAGGPAGSSTAAHSQSNSESDSKAHAKTTPHDPCAGRVPRQDQFDVFFQGPSAHAIAAATAKVKAAGLSDWFASTDRVYVGRYGDCGLAEHRRHHVHRETGLPLWIDAVNARLSHQATTVSSRPATTPRPAHFDVAPFAIVSVELRGSHRYIGVAPAHQTVRLGNITWLSPGQSYDAWQLEQIQTGTATFITGGHTMTVALPPGAGA